jgi:ADP-ribosylglycohydrolase
METIIILYISLAVLFLISPKERSKEEMDDKERTLEDWNKPTPLRKVVNIIGSPILIFITFTTAIYIIQEGGDFEDAKQHILNSLGYTRK